MNNWPRRLGKNSEGVTRIPALLRSSFGSSFEGVDGDSFQALDPFESVYVFSRKKRLLVRLIVRKTACVSLRRECSPLVQEVAAIDVLLCRHGCSSAC